MLARAVSSMTSAFFFFFGLSTLHTTAVPLLASEHPLFSTEVIHGIPLSMQARFGWNVFNGG